MRETSVSIDAVVWTFHESLPEKVREFGLLWDAWQADPPSRAACDAFRLLIHRMSGASAAFGYESLAERAVALDRLLKPGVCDEEELPHSVYRRIESAARELLDELRQRTREGQPPVTPR